MFALFFCHMERIKPADKEHIRVIDRSIVKRAGLEVSDDKRGKAIIIVIIDDREMVLHSIPVVGVKTGASQVQAVSGLLDLFGTGRLSGNRSDILAKEHGVYAEDPVSDGIFDTIPFNLRIHYLVVIILRLF